MNEQQHKEMRFNVSLRRLEVVGACLSFPPLLQAKLEKVKMYLAVYLNELLKDISIF